MYSQHLASDFSCWFDWTSSSYLGCVLPHLESYLIEGVTSWLCDLMAISHISGLTLSLNASAYSVAESDGFVNICIFGLRGNGSTSTTATISTEDISATRLSFSVVI